MESPSQTAAPAPIKDEIRAEAKALGFEVVGFARATAIPDGRADLAEFTGAGYHGDMGWMAARERERAHPTRLWPETRTVISLAMNYGQGAGPRYRPARPERGVIAAYARGRDYHLVMKARLKRLARWVHERYGADVKVFVDTAPVMEKPVAETAGVGWQGKHTNLVSREFGSWLFLGEVFTTLDIEPDSPEADHCGSCRACLDACPTDAFPAPGKLDARRCISYLTIEHAGHIDREFRAAMGNRIYGCDDCLAVCPWNKYARASREIAFLPRIELTAPKLADLAKLDDAAFRRVFSTSPIKRLGRDRFIRNVLIAIGNSADPALAGEAERLLGDGSSLVRAMAVWALSRLMDTERFAALRARARPSETDPAVLAEWDHAEAELFAAPGAAAQ